MPQKTSACYLLARPLLDTHASDLSKGVGLLTGSGGSRKRPWCDGPSLGLKKGTLFVCMVPSLDTTEHSRCKDIIKLALFCTGPLKIQGVLGLSSTLPPP